MIRLLVVVPSNTHISPRRPSTSGPDVDGLRGDICVFDGTTTNNLIMKQTGAAGSGEDAGCGGPTGVRLHLTSGQTHSVTIKSPGGTTAGWRFQNILIDPGA